MPYKLEKTAGGRFKVCDPMRCFSKVGLTKEQAMKQRVAIALSEHRKTGKPMKHYFA
jgi:hypothetical protein